MHALCLLAKMRTVKIKERDVTRTEYSRSGEKYTFNLTSRIERWSRKIAGQGIVYVGDYIRNSIAHGTTSTSELKNSQ